MGVGAVQLLLYLLANVIYHHKHYKHQKHSACLHIIARFNNCIFVTDTLSDISWDPTVTGNTIRFTNRLDQPRH